MLPLVHYLYLSWSACSMSASVRSPAFVCFAHPDVGWIRGTGGDERRSGVFNTTQNGV
ncbi:hypothetical protein RTS15_004839 [Salmonella enterica]|nr:hypothetical protein [Salmonella enterica]ELJ4826100.1 hypothetical protein [Salmonella enterica]